MAANATPTEQVSALLFPEEGGTETEEVTSDEQVEEDEVVEEESDEEGTEEDEVEGDADESDESEEEEASAQSDEEYDIDRLAKETGVDTEFIYNVKIPMPDNEGNTSFMTFGELKDAHVESVRKSEESKKIVEEFTNQKSSLQQNYHQIMQLPIEVARASAAVDQIKENYNSVDWDALRKQDETKYTSLRLDYQDAFQKAQSNANNLFQQYQQQDSQFKESQLIQAQKQLIEAIPEWSNESVFREEGSAVGRVLLENGFTQEEVDNITDPRIIVMARKTMKLDREKRQGQKTLKVVKTKPKTLKSGMNRSAAVKKKQVSAQMIKKAKGGTREQKSAAIRNLLEGSGAFG